MSVVSYVKENPWTVVGIVGAGLALYFLWSYAGSSGGGSVAVIGPSPEQVQANTALQVAQLQANAQSQALQYELAGRRDAIAGSIAIENIRGNVALYEAQTGGTIALAQTEAQRQLGLASVSAQTIIATQAQETERRQIAAIEAINVGAQQVTKELAYYSAETQRTSIAAQVAIADINAQTSRYVAGSQASVAKNQTNKSFLGGLFGGLLSFI